MALRVGPDCDFFRMGNPMTVIPPHKPNANADPASASASESSRKRFRRRLGMFLGLLAVGAVVFAPMFVAKTSLRHRILPMLLPEYPAEITTGRATLLWWASVELGDVQFHDTEGQPFLHIEKITSEKSLAALLLDRVQVGGFSVEQPKLKILVREGGSNLEEAIAPLLAPAEDSPGAGVCVLRAGRAGGNCRCQDPSEKRTAKPAGGRAAAPRCCGSDHGSRSE